MTGSVAKVLAKYEDLSLYAQNSDKPGAVMHTGNLSDHIVG